MRMPACIQFQAPVCSALLRISFNPCSFCFGFKLGSRLPLKTASKPALHRNQPVQERADHGLRIGVNLPD